MQNCLLRTELLRRIVAFFTWLRGQPEALATSARGAPPRANTYNAKPATSDDLVLYDLLGGDGQGSGQCVD